MKVDVTRSKLDELLAVGTELADLDYKRTVDLKAHHDTIEIIKDIGAFMDHGGYIVIGADDHGDPVDGIQPGQEALFDEARLRPSVARYIPSPFTIATKIHDVGGVSVGLIQVLPHPHGACVFQKQGEYQHPTTGKPVVVFRANEIFTRHGTSSERADGHDLQRIRQKGTTAPEPPRADMDETTLRRAVADALRDKDKITLVDVLDDLRESAEESVASGDGNGLLSALDKLTSVAATAIKYGETHWIAEVVGRLQSVYEVGFRDRVAIGGGAPRLWLDVVARAMAIGALTVAAGRDDLVPTLALRKPAGMDQRIFTNWITHAAVNASRAGFLGANSERGEITFLRAVEVEVGPIGAMSALRSTEDRQNALAQFDVLAAVAVWGQEKDGEDEYPYWATFAGYYQDRYEPAIVRLVQDRSLRESIFGGTDDELRQVLRILEAQGRKHLASFGGGGAQYVAPEIHQFLNG